MKSQPQNPEFRINPEIFTHVNDGLNIVSYIWRALCMKNKQSQSSFSVMW